MRAQIALLVSGIVLACACGKDKPPPPPPAPTEGITIIERGAEPRTLLRYALAKGTMTPLTLELDITIDAGGQGGAMPTLVLGTEVAIEDTQPDGHARVRTTITQVGAKERANAPVSAADMATHSQLMRGLTLVGTVAPNGELPELHAEAPTKLPPAMASQLDTLTKSFQQLAVPLPAEPVGVGARWLYRTTITQGNGMKLRGETTFVVQRIEASQVALASTTILTGDDQVVTQGDASMKLTKVGGEGHGTTVIDLSRMTMTGELTTAFHSDMVDGTDATTMTMTLATRMTAGAPPPPSPPADTGSAAGSASGSGSGNSGSGSGSGASREASPTDH